MPPIIAAVIFAISIGGLFYLDREHNTRTSKALWIPAAWLFILSSRPVSLWLGMAPSASTDANLDGSPIDAAVFAVLVLAAWAVVISRMESVGPLLRQNVPILVFLLYCMVSIVWSDYPFVALKRYIKATGDLAMVLIIVTESDPAGAAKRLLIRLGFLLFPLSILFIKYYPHLGRLLTASWTTTFVGVTTQKNSLGAICLLYGVGFLWMLQCVHHDRADLSRRRRLLAYGTVLLMIVWSLNMSDSMTSATGFAMAGGVTLLVGRPLFIRKRALVHIAVLAVVGIAVFALFFDSGGGLLESLGKDPTLTGRTDIWRRVLSVPINQWVGTGFESFWLGPRLKAMRSAGYNFDINEAHNGYLEVYLNLGWVGVTLLSILLLTGYKRVIVALREDPERGSLLLGFFLITLFESLTEAAFRMVSPIWLFFLLAIVSPRKLFRPGPQRGWEADSLPEAVRSEGWQYANESV
jgi:exopolysaccharide production protein ExoQ